MCIKYKKNTHFRWSVEEGVKRFQSTNSSSDINQLRRGDIRTDNSSGAKTSKGRNTKRKEKLRSADMAQLRFQYVFKGSQ